MRPDHPTLSLLLLLALSLFGRPSMGAERAFTLSGVSLTLEEMSADLEVRYSGMRFNRANNQWHAEMRLYNRGARMLRGPFVVRVESHTGTAAPVDYDGLDPDAAGQPI